MITSLEKTMTWLFLMNTNVNHLLSTEEWMKEWINLMDRIINHIGIDSNINYWMINIKLIEIWLDRNKEMIKSVNERSRVKIINL